MSFPVAGLIHEYAPRHIAFEFAPAAHKNVVIFIGGLMDGLLTVPYLQRLAEELAKINYSLVQIEFSSSHIGWGTGSLNRDSTEISQLVTYLKSEKGGKRSTIGLMGHSTGCQNTTHYFTRQERDDPAKYSAVDFGILQAPASDRASATMMMSKEELDESLVIANDLIAQGRSDEIMPHKFIKRFFNVPINAYRWNSLMAVRGDDDFFSPDLEDADFATTFGKFDRPFLVLYSGSDEYVPKWLDKEALLDRWAKVASVNWSQYSTVVEGASHNIGEGSTNNAQKNAVDTVIKFIQSI